ncbi:MAG: L-threonylcarbamoyladenylate synthase [Candidatus Sericytochromatia bacterium]
MTHTTSILSPTPEHLAQAALLLQNGEVVAMPTETVYGLAASLWQEAGLMRVFASKERPQFDPLIVHLSAEMAADANLMATLVDFGQISLIWQKQVAALKAAFWPGPLTLVLPKTAKVPDLATSGLATIALRVPAHPVAQALIQATGAPLAAPSANRFGRISPTTAQAVYEELAGRIPLILDGGPCEVGLESTVLGWDARQNPQILRPGQISAAEISQILGTEVHEAALHPVEIQAPGMLKNHYAPRKPLFLLPENWRLENKQILPENPAGLQLAAPKAGFLLLEGDAEALSSDLLCPVVTLSKNGSRADCARQLFAALRHLDASSADFLWAEIPSDTEGLGYAIANRLSKAAFKNN